MDEICGSIKKLGWVWKRAWMMFLEQTGKNFMSEARDKILKISGKEIMKESENRMRKNLKGTKKELSIKLERGFLVTFLLLSILFPVPFQIISHVIHSYFSFK